MGKYFDNTDVVPRISQIIHNLSGSENRLIHHDEIVFQLLTDPENTNFVDLAYKKYQASEDNWSRKQFVSNMVQWFSAWWKKGLYDLQITFKREEKNGKAAYKVAKEK